MFRKSALTLALALLTVSGVSHADVIYGNVSTPPGVYFGSGNPNGNFWVNTDEPGLELGLRAKNRRPGDPPLIDGSSGVYRAAPGTIAPGNVRVMYNYEFSILSNTGLDSYIYRLGVDHDPSAGFNFSVVDPLAQWGDNATYVNGLIEGIQASQNVGFGDTPGGPLTGGPAGTYSFYLAAYAIGTQDFDIENALAVSSITVQVPEPGTLALFGAALAGVAGLRRSQRKSQA